MPGTPGTATRETIPSERAFSPDDPIQVSADRFSGDVADRTGLFEGNVRFAWGKFTITCDRLELSPTVSGVSARIVAEGNVRITWSGWHGQAGRIAYDADTQTLIMEQDSILEVRGADLSGPHLTIDLKSGHVRCDHCRIQWTMEAQP